jgi:argininosuccinate synthase
LKTREAEIMWAEEHGVPVRATKDSPYSIDENLWGISIEAGPLEDPWVEPPPDCWQWTADPAADLVKPESVTIGFEAGVPVSIDGQTMDGVELIGVLNVLAGAHGVGRIDMVEDRLVGIKSREIYEAPGAVTLHAARTALAQLTLDRNTRRVLAAMGQEFAQLVYDGLWFTPLRTAISAFVDQAVAPMTGEVRIKLHAGTAMPVARRSPNSLYDEALATYSDGDAFDHDAAQGFIELFGQSAKVTNAAMREAALSSAISTVTAVDA